MEAVRSAMVSESTIRPAVPRRVDEAVIEACRRGERDAFRVVYEAYSDRVYSIALHFSGDASTASDVTQQVFLKLFTTIAQFRNDSDFATWLYRIVANACLDERRRGKRLVQLSEASEVTAMTTRDSQEARFARRRVAEAVRAAVAELSPKLRLPILLRYAEEMSYEEIAAVLGCSKGTVASRLNRGHKALARRLAHLRAELVEGE